MEAAAICDYGRRNYRSGFAVNYLAQCLWINVKALKQHKPAAIDDLGAVEKYFAPYLANLDQSDVIKHLDLPCAVDFADMTFVKDNSPEKILESACTSDSLSNVNAFMICVLRYFVFSILLDAGKADFMKKALLSDCAGAKSAFKNILNKLTADQKTIEYLNKLKKDVTGVKGESLTEAALNYAEQEQKMIDWHNGVRKQNVKACSDAKLQLNFDICLERDFLKESRELFNELRARGGGTSKLCMTFEGEYLIKKFRLPGDCPDDYYAIYSHIMLSAKLDALNFNNSSKPDYIP